MWKKKLSNLLSSIIITNSLVIPVSAQIPIIDQGINQLLAPDQEKKPDSSCIRLDSRCLFEVAPLDGDFSGRIEEIDSRLKDITKSYFRSKTDNLEIRSENIGNLRNIYVKVDDNQIRLLTVTQADAILNSVTVEVKTEEIIENLEKSLKQAKKERQFDSLLVQTGLAVATAASMLLIRAC